MYMFEVSFLLFFFVWLSSGCLLLFAGMLNVYDSGHTATEAAHKLRHYPGGLHFVHADELSARCFW